MNTPGVTGDRTGPGPGCGPPPGLPGAVKERVESRRFGTVEVPSDRVLRFVHPVVGFHDLEHYAVIEDRETAPLLWIQALDAPDVLLPAVDAGLVAGDYAVSLTEEDARTLQLDRPGDARLLLVLTLNPEPSAITANLRAPIVWNTRRAMAMQLVLQDSNLSVAHPLGLAGGECRSNKEVARACSHPPQR